MSEQKKSIDLWEKVRIVGTLAATIAIPLAIALIGHWYTTALKQKELGHRYVELAITILSDQPQEHTLDIRRWAIDIVNTYSIVKMPIETKTQLLNNPIQIREDLDGNLKSSAELLKETEELQKRWKQLIGQESLQEQLRNLAKQPNKEIQ